MSIQAKTPRNYLNNKDILAEIHKSKKSYCVFTKPEYSDFDIILQSIDQIRDSIQIAKIARAKRLTIAAQDLHLQQTGTKLKSSDAFIDPDSILDTDLIFRIMSWDHIPERPKKVAPIKKSRGRPAKAIEIPEEPELELDSEIELPELENPTAIKYVKLNFPPFVHYKFDELGDLKLVGKSHWKGDLVTGEFSKDHGKPTNKLALMWMKMCDRYATRGNWRGYSYNEEMKSQALLQLCMAGLQFDESKSDNPFSYYTAAMNNSFVRVFNVEKKQQMTRDDLLIDAGYNPSFGRQSTDYSSDTSD